MRKLLNGILEYRQNVQEEYREKFGALAIGQSPDALFVACSDSRVVPNVFASTDPGDLFVLRNVGNLIPKAGEASEKSEAAAIEFSMALLKVSDVIICGHSDCGAMRALLEPDDQASLPHLKGWLRHGLGALQGFTAGHTLDKGLAPHNQLSQLNVLHQMEHVKSYHLVRERMATGDLAVHGWWFDIARADVYAYDKDAHRFLLIDEGLIKKVLESREI